jgi:hypothetical protein
VTFLNLAVRNAHYDPSLLLALFPADEWVEVVDKVTFDMYDLLVRVGAFPSRGQARKNWKLTGADIPPGFNHWVIGKKRDKELCVWNPVDDGQEPWDVALMHARLETGE